MNLDRTYPPAIKIEALTGFEKLNQMNMGRGSDVPHNNQLGQCDTSTKYSCTSSPISTDIAMNDDSIMIASPTNLALPKGMQSLP